MNWPLASKLSLETEEQMMAEEGLIWHRRLIHLLPFIATWMQNNRADVFISPTPVFLASHFHRVTTARQKGIATKVLMKAIQEALVETQDISGLSRG